MRWQIPETDGNWSGEENNSGVARNLRGGEERLGMGGNPGLGVGEREDGTSGRVLCRQQTVRIAVNAFGVPKDLLTPDQADEGAVKENFLQRAPHMFMKIGEERT